MARYSLTLSGLIPTAGELGHLEFLSMLRSEIDRCDVAALDRFVIAARFETTANFDEFDCSYNPATPAVTIGDVATVRFAETGGS